MLEEKKAPEPPSRLLRTTDEKGETVLVPLSEDDYQLRKEKLKVVGVEKPNGEIQLDEPEAQPTEEPEAPAAETQTAADTAPVPAPEGGDAPAAEAANAPADPAPEAPKSDR